MKKEQEDKIALRNTLDFIVREIGKRVEIINNNPYSLREAHLFELDLDAYKNMKKMAEEFHLDTYAYDLKLESFVKKLKRGDR